MPDQTSKSTDTNPIQRIFAHVTLVPFAEQGAFLECTRGHTTQAVYEQRFTDIRSPDRLDVRVKLSAENLDGRPIEGKGTIGISVACANSDTHNAVENQIDLLLGRNPALHRPPRLAWDGLIVALREADIHVTEEQLIATELTLDFADNVCAEIKQPKPTILTRYRASLREAYIRHRDTSKHCSLFKLIYFTNCRLLDFR